MKILKNFRLNVETVELLNKLKIKKSLSMTRIIEDSIKKEATRNGLTKEV